jgi:hypothetical protein
MRLPLLTVALIAVVATFTSAAQGRFNPNAPTVPVWTHTVKLPPPDGRVFVTDGRLTVDIKVGKPAIRPSTVMAADTTRAIANYLLAPYPTEFGLADLKASESGNTFSGPAGVVLSTYYVAFLRREAPRVRLRVRGQYDPLLIVLDGRPVGLLMPGA